MTDTNIFSNLLKQFGSNLEIVSEGTANKKTNSQGLEAKFAHVLTEAGIQDLSEEWSNFNKGNPNIFSSLSKKASMKKVFAEYKHYVNDYGGYKISTIRKDTENRFPKNCFIRHPNGPQAPIDFLVIINGYMFYMEMKTGEGKNGKLNDCIIPAQFFVLMSSSHKNVGNPYTWFQMNDWMTEGVYDHYLRLNNLLPELITRARDEPGHDADDVKDYMGAVSLRYIFSWGKKNSDWYTGIDLIGNNREARQQRAIDIIKGYEDIV